MRNIHEAHAFHLKAIPLRILFALNSYDKGDGIFPMEVTIAKATTLRQCQVNIAKKELREKGFIDWVLEDRGRGKLICHYEIKEKSYSQPEDWNPSKHLFMYRSLWSDFSAEEWRFLCLINTINGWHTYSLRKRLKLWGMGLGHYKKMKDRLDAWMMSENRVEGTLIYQKDRPKPAIF